MKRVPLEVQIGELLKAKKVKLVLAESCTGGLIGHMVTNIPGSSDYYLGSVTAYAYEAKETLLGVSHETLNRFGAVSRQTVLEMAAGARKSLAGQIPLDTIIGVSVSGIAGPGGGLPGKPVGTVWIGMSTPTGEWAWRLCLKGDRIKNKKDSAKTVLKLICLYLEDTLPPESWPGCREVGL